MGIALFGIGYVSMFKSSKKQAWHDKVAKTIVIYSSEPKSIVKTILLYFLVSLGLVIFVVVAVYIKNVLLLPIGLLPKSSQQILMVRIALH